MSMVILQTLKTPLAKEEWESGYWLYADNSVVVEDYETFLDAYDAKYKDIWQLYNGFVDENVSKAGQVWFPVYEDRSHRNWPVRMFEGYDRWIIDRNFFKDEWESGYWMPCDRYNRDLDVLLQDSYPLLNGKTDSILSDWYYLTSHWIPCNSDRSPRPYAYVSAKMLIQNTGVTKEDLFAGFQREDDGWYKGKLVVNQRNLSDIANLPRLHKVSIGATMLYNSGAEGIISFIDVQEVIDITLALKN